jgi:hypothetical protein
MAYQLKIPAISDPRGSLLAIDKVLPFEIKRVFFIYDVTAERGGHRHHVCRMAMIAVQGQVEVFCDNGQEKKTFQLNSPEDVLVIEPEDWHTMKFSPDAVLTVMASHSYDKSDYVHERYP